MPTAITSLDDILAQIKAPKKIGVDCGAVSKGIDNYHVDIEVSASFTLRVKECVEHNLKRLVTGKALVSGNAEMMHEVRDAYTDLVKVTLHRSKTDLTREQIQILQFGLVKFVMQEIRDGLDQYSDQLEATLGQQQFSGSRSLMATQERVQWFRTHRGEFMFRLNRLLLRQLQREENNQLKTLREQVLGAFPEGVNVLFNPMLYGMSPRDPLLLLDYYAVWPGNGVQFDAMNRSIEEVIRKHLPDQSFDSLKSGAKSDSAQSEVYDELGGLFAAQTLLGSSPNQKEMVSESFGWLDHPGNMRLLFDEKIHARHLNQEGLGLTGGWSLKGDVKKLQKIVTDLRKSIGDSKAVKAILASYALREKLTQLDLNLIDIDTAIELVVLGDSKKVQEAIDPTGEGASLLVTKLIECASVFNGMMKDAGDELFVRLLTDYARYRLHLKYYRFAHRMFNRVSVIVEPEKAQLAKAGGNLYQLLSSDEVKGIGGDEEPEIVHHAILKADVRGSTTVTAELLRQGLNPASYFSLRFFNPINECLGAYGAVKVFIEGDAVILGVYEHSNAPDEWFSVSRACGIAKEMLDIVNSKNTHSKQTGLPVLEIGIGICYADDRPMFLFDDNRPIMISSAIGDADRMSGCSWRLRDSYSSENFNVAAFQMGDKDDHKGEKGQDLIRYNVNGIVIDDAAFEKLQTEVHFRRLKARSGDGEEIFHVGKFPDVLGKQRDLVVRQGKVGIFDEGLVNQDADTGLFYYEILPNSKFAGQIVDLASKKAG